ncbi:erythropoietin [Pseudorca crassidens]
MGVRGEYSRPRERPPARPLFEEEFTAGAVGPGVAGFKDLRLAKDPGRARGVGQPSPAGRAGGSPREKCLLLLLLSLLLLPLGLPVLGAPPHLICDSRVLERYILEAREAENATLGCAEGCSFSENITVPDTKVNFYAWKRMEVQQQAVEVWQGLALLSEAILQGQALLANLSQPSEALQLHVDKAVSGLRSLTSLLRALGAQKGAVPLPNAASSAAPLRTFTVDTLCKLFRIYSNFLRGKLTLYTGEACRRGDR